MESAQAGQDITVRVRAVAQAGRVVREGTVTAQFWAPGHDPRQHPAFCDLPDHECPCQFDPSGKPGWVAQTPTGGWPPGRWTVRGHVDAGAVGWAWDEFTLRP